MAATGTYDATVCHARALQEEHHEIVEGTGRRDQVVMLTATVSKNSSTTRRTAYSANYNDFLRSMEKEHEDQNGDLKRHVYQEKSRRRE